MDGITNTKLLTYNIKVRKVVSNIVRYWRSPDNQIAAMVVSNIIACARKGSHLVYSRDTSTKKFRGKRDVSVYKLIKVVDWLEQEGYITNHIGKPSKIAKHREVSYMDIHYRSLIQFGLSHEDIMAIENDQIEALDVVELRDSEKNAIAFRESKIVREMKENVRAINMVNSKHDVRDGFGEPLNNIYCRIFNETFDNGGRFYRADVLRLNNTENPRIKVTIDGEEVIEADFANLHFRICAALEGIDSLSLPLDVYSGMLEDESNQWDRKIVKLAVNIMFNSRSEDSAIRAINKAIFDFGRNKSKITVGAGKSIVALVKDNYPEFTDMFCSSDSYGRRLQYLDSELACDIMLKFIGEGKPILPIHDSFLVKRCDLDMLCSAMGDSFRKQFDVDTPVPIGIKFKGFDGNTQEDRILV